VSLVGALTPLGKVARDWKTWFSAVLLYTLSGLGVSAGIGAALGGLGRLAGVATVRHGVLLAGAVLALVLAAREWGLVRFRLPERPLQTEKIWMHEFGPLGAATLWGLHLSLGFFTRVNYGGFWLLVLLAVGLGDPVYGALLAGGHWLGKTLPVWVAPLAYRDPNEADDLMRIWEGRTAVYARFQGLGLLAAATVLAVWLAAGRG
jgi:hypothetical protein